MTKTPLNVRPFWIEVNDGHTRPLKTGPKRLNEPLHVDIFIRDEQGRVQKCLRIAGYGDTTSRHLKIYDVALNGCETLVHRIDKDERSGATNQARP